MIPRRCEQTTEPQDVITHIEEAEVDASVPCSLLSMERAADEAEGLM